MKIFFISLGLLVIVSQEQYSFAGAQDDEQCTQIGCSERTINRPLGVQPPQVEIQSFQDEISLRATMRFPDFDSSWGMQREIFDRAQRYYETNKGSIENTRYFMIVDFNLHSSKRRFFLFDLSNGKVEKHNVAAGKNSDPDNNGFATSFSNTPESLKSSLGFYRTLSTYKGAHGYSLRLQGLSASNSNAESRDIVMHPADYVKDGGKTGRSWGCPALDPKVSRGIIDKVKNGAILLIDK